MIHIRENVYSCPVCGHEKKMTSSEAKQHQVCSLTCREVLKESNRIVRAKNKNIAPYLSKTQTKLYSVWNTIKQRCRNPKNKTYQRYGAMGINMCDEWFNDYIVFGEWALSKGYVEQKGKLTADTLTIDRIDPEGDYNPSNCRIITHSLNSSLAENGMNKKVYVYKIDGSYIATYKSITDAGKVFGVELRHVAEAIDPESKRKQAGGYRFSFSHLENLPIDKTIRNTNPIEGFNFDGVSVGIFKQKKDACDTLGISAPSNISAVLNGKRKHTKGFTFKYV